MKVLSLTTATILGLSAVLLALAISAPVAQMVAASAPWHCTRAGRHVLSHPDIAWHPVSG
jgi:hypothetical protein